MNEVYAHAVLGKHQHVVRYYSAWAEDDYMYIQNEYCNGKKNCCLSRYNVIFNSPTKAKKWFVSGLQHENIGKVHAGRKFISFSKIFYIDLHCY